MIEMVNTGSERVIGVLVDGKIDEADIERIIQTAEPLLEKHDRLSVYVEVRAVGMISLPALIKDVKFGIPNLKRFEKKAVVSDKKWIAETVKWGDKLFPSLEVRHFSPDQREAALEWARERA